MRHCFWVIMILSLTHKSNVVIASLSKNINTVPKNIMAFHHRASNLLYVPHFSSSRLQFHSMRCGNTHRSLIEYRDSSHNSLIRNDDIKVNAAAATENKITSTRDEKYQQMMTATPLSLAPMMEVTDRHFRHLVRLMSTNTLLYSEMVTGNAIAHERRDAKNRQSDNISLNYKGKQPVPKSNILLRQSEQDVSEFGYDMTYLRRFLGQGQIDPLDDACVLQLGGCCTEMMSEACTAVMELTSRGYCDYTAINLNCGCPSPKVAGKGCFGAALMDDATLVKNVVKSMSEGCNNALPITVKCRIGTDTGFQYSKQNYYEQSDEEEYSKLCQFIETVASSDVVTDFQIHARIAVLSKKFSPADNRKVPELKYHYIRKLVEDYPELSFSLNGGIDSLMSVKRELHECKGLKGVMVGRAFAANPWTFAMADHVLNNDNSPIQLVSNKPKNRLELLKAYCQHADMEEEIWGAIKVRRFIVKAISTLFTGEHNSKFYKIALNDIAGLPKKLSLEGKSMEGQPPLSESIMNAALEHLSEEVLLMSPEESLNNLIFEEERQNNARNSILIAG